jgi:signal peptidase I
MNVKTKSHHLFKEILSISYAIIAALVIRTLVLELFFVPTGSMKATILEGDYIFATKYSYGYSNYSMPFSPNLFAGRILSSQPDRGDIVIFRPPHNMDIRYVKRLIGAPGDKIEVKDDLIYINDLPIERTPAGLYTSEDGKFYRRYKEVLPGGASYYSYKLENADSKINVTSSRIFLVPQGTYFFMGDNRDESNDSRIGLGYVPFENFIAKGRFIFFSTATLLFSMDKSIVYFPQQVWDWLCSIRFARILTSV